MIVQTIISIATFNANKKGMVWSMFLKILLALLVLGIGIALVVIWNNKSSETVDSIPGILEGF